MPTKIYCANLIIDAGKRKITLSKCVIKRIPIHLLLSDSSFIKWLKVNMIKKDWEEISKSTIKISNIEYLTYLGQPAQEPELPI